MTTIANFQTLFDDRVRSTGERFTLPQRDRAIAQAVKAYAQTRPLVTAQDYAGDGSAFDFALPAGWVDGISSVEAIEYPQGERRPVFLAAEDWTFYQSPTGKQLRLLAITPASGKTMRVLYTKPHLLDATQSTISAADEEAVADLAASIGLLDLAAVYAHTQDPTITADSVNYGDKARAYTDLARELRGRYRKHLGLDKDNEVQAAGGFVDQDRQASDGRDLLTHPKRLR